MLPTPGKQKRTQRRMPQQSFGNMHTDCIPIALFNTEKLHGSMTLARWFNLALSKQEAAEKQIIACVCV